MARVQVWKKAIAIPKTDLAMMSVRLEEVYNYTLKDGSDAGTDDVTANIRTAGDMAYDDSLVHTRPRLEDPNASSADQAAHAAMREEKLRRRLVDIQQYSAKKFRTLVVTCIRMQLTEVRMCVKPIVDLFVLKTTQIERAAEAGRTMRQWLIGRHEEGGLQGASFDMVTFEKDAEVGRALATQLDAALYGPPVDLPGFKDMRPEQVAAYDAAADYTDEWSIRLSDKTSMRVFYKCTGRIGNEFCRTVTVSSHWRRKFSDPLSAKQRWYCPVCECRYKTTMGVLVEFRIGMELRYAMAEFPPMALQKVKWTAVQRKFGVDCTPEEFCRRIPEARVYDSAILHKVQGFDQCYTYNVEALREAPTFNWTALLQGALTEGVDG